MIERAVIVSETDTLVIDESWLPGETLAVPPPTGALAHELASREREMIEAALASSKGRVSGLVGAARLGIPASTRIEDPSIRHSEGSVPEKPDRMTDVVPVARTPRHVGERKPCVRAVVSSKRRPY